MFWPLGSSEEFVMLRGAKAAVGVEVHMVERGTPLQHMKVRRQSMARACRIESADSRALCDIVWQLAQTLRCTQGNPTIRWPPLFHCQLGHHLLPYLGFQHLGQVVVLLSSLAEYLHNGCPDMVGLRDLTLDSPMLLWLCNIGAQIIPHNVCPQSLPFAVTRAECLDEKVPPTMAD
jgi:hypothetical protein